MGLIFHIPLRLRCMFLLKFLDAQSISLRGCIRSSVLPSVRPSISHNAFSQTRAMHILRPVWALFFVISTREDRCSYKTDGRIYLLMEMTSKETVVLTHETDLLFILMAWPP